MNYWHLIIIVTLTKIGVIMKNCKEDYSFKTERATEIILLWHFAWTNDHIIILVIISISIRESHHFHHSR